MTALLKISDYPDFIVCTVNYDLLELRAKEPDFHLILYEKYCLWYEEGERILCKLDRRMLLRDDSIVLAMPPVAGESGRFC